MSKPLELTEEETFSSDGLPPLPPPSVPLTSLATGEKDGDLLDKGNDVDLVHAFETFSGKMFFPPSKPNHQLGVETSTTSAIETPLQRLARLRMEVKELEGDFEKIESADFTNGENDPTKFGGDVLKDLSSRLTSLSNSNGVVSAVSMQSDLTNVLSRELTKLKERKSKNNTESSTEAQSAGITYELYPVSNDSKSDVSLETRLTQIENTLGVASETSSLLSGSVLNRLKQVEQLAKSVDLKSLDVAAARAKIIRTDLEAVAKQRSKLPLPPEDSKIITQLHDQMQSLSTLSNDLPLIVTRLTDLAYLHTQASNFATTLVAAENNVTNVERMLVNFENVLDKVEAGCVDNLQIVEENIKGLDERMNSLRI